MRTFKLQVVTPDGEVYNGEAESLLIRTSDGDVEFLAGHIDYIASVGTGRARIKENGTDRFASVSRGIVTVKDGAVTLAAVTFEFSENIDVARAERAKEAAEEKLRVAHDERTVKLAKAKLERAISRIKAADLK